MVVGIGAIAEFCRQRDRPIFIGQSVVLKAQHFQSRFGEASFLILLVSDWSYQAGYTVCK
ncbi:hypothetical protein [Nostoc sp. FACHB-888]|uniref:hypothetical protein n=1 Tax=Nostoc sp. FACHB-888 TaxID=2692842 RepID=UPI00168823C1|nr:hypothetical protein [Nostoc sp. FACHB-888]MBD2249151.1 hypothetical protein [Nostoc sp. FACHB-888]